MWTGAEVWCGKQTVMYQSCLQTYACELFAGALDSASIYNMQGLVTSPISECFYPYIITIRKKTIGFLYDGCEN